MMKSYYIIEGTCARQVITKEVYEERQRKYIKQRLRSQVKRRVQLKYYTRQIIVYLGLIVGTLIIYASLKSSIFYQQKKIARLETQIAQVKSDNRLKENKLANIHLDEVKERAKQLGMKEASKDQIIYVPLSTDDFMDIYYR